MVVRIVKDWHYPQSFFGQTPNGDGVWDGITFTEEPVQKCDVLVVLQRPPYSFSVECPKGNAWLITQEPPVEYFRFFQRSFKYFDRVYTHFKDVRSPHLMSMQPVLPWHILRSYRELKSISLNDALSVKTDRLVWVTSSKRGFEGQNARMEFRDHLARQQFPVALYGRGFTPIHDKFDALFPSKYALSIENYSTPDYWTEKIADCFLSWSLPFYWGASNIKDFFPSESFIAIDIKRPDEAMRIISEAIKNKEWEKRVDAIAYARELILEKYQFFPYVSRMVHEACSGNKGGALMKYQIPGNPYPWSYKRINQMKYFLKRVRDLLMLNSKS